MADAQARLDRALESAQAAPDVARRRQRDRNGPRGVAKARAPPPRRRAHRLHDAEAAEAAAREPLEAAEREVQRLSAEVKALGDLLHPEGEGLFPPLVDAVTVQSGYEAALAAALGDDLQAPLDEFRAASLARSGRVRLRSDPLPAGVKPLSDFVKAPAALARRLAMTGLVFPDQGAALQKQLKPGQRLVSARGDLWRWDGYVASADAPSPAAVRLSQRNRLTALEQEADAGQGRPRRTLCRLFRRQGCRQAAREAARAAEEAERAAEQSADRRAGPEPPAPPAPPPSAPAQLAILEAEIRRLAQSVEAAEESNASAARRRWKNWATAWR